MFESQPFDLTPHRIHVSNVREVRLKVELKMVGEVRVVREVKCG